MLTLLTIAFLYTENKAVIAVGLTSFIDMPNIVPNMGNNQRMDFDFTIFSNTRSIPISKVNNEQIMEIEKGAKGDKIIGLMTN